MAAIAAESASELKRSGGFELIFPVGDTAQNYFRFFDNARPLERMLAASTKPKSSAVTGTPAARVRSSGLCVEGRK